MKSTEDKAINQEILIHKGIVEYPSLNNLAEIVSMACSIPEREIKNCSSREDRVRIPRQIFEYVATEYYSYSLSEVARYTRRNHATVINSRKQVANAISVKFPPINSLRPYIAVKEALGFTINKREFDILADFLREVELREPARERPKEEMLADNFKNIKLYEDRESACRSVKERYEAKRDELLYGVEPPHKPIVKLHKDTGQEIARYRDIYEASASMALYVKHPYQVIADTLSGITKTGAGYKWLDLDSITEGLDESNY